jgi:hypothetical protein
MTKEQILKRIDELLAVKSPAGDMDGIAEAVMECYQGTLTLLNTLYGSGSMQADALRKAADRASKEVGHAAFGLGETLWPATKGTLRTLKAEVGDGLVGTIARRAAGEVMVDFLGLAKEALADGRTDAKNVAAVLVAASFEDTIRKMGEALAGVNSRPDLSDVMLTLKKANVLMGATFTTAQGYLKFRNDALHADWSKITPALIASCLSFTEGLLVQHFS